MTRVKYTNYAVDANGETLSGNQVEVRDSQGNLATLYESATGSTEAYSGANPFSAGDGTPDKVGLFQFFVEPGTYSITVGVGGAATTYPLEAIPSTKALNFDSLSDFDDWVNSGVAVAEDGTTAFANGLAFVAQSGADVFPDSAMSGWLPSEPVYVNHFGAVGDDTTDSTSAINAALAYAKGRVVKVLKGKYLTTGPIDMPQFTTLVMEGGGYTNAAESWIRYTGSDQAVRGVDAWEDTDNSRNIRLDGLNIRLEGDGATGLLVQAAKAWSIRDCSIRAGGANQTLLHMRAERDGDRVHAGNFYNIVEQVKLLGGGFSGCVGLRLTGENNNGMNNANTLIEVSAEACTTSLLMDNCVGNYIGITSEATTTRALWLLSGCTGNEISTYIEGDPAGIFLASGANRNDIRVRHVSAGKVPIEQDNGTNNKIYFDGNVYVRGKLYLAKGDPAEEVFQTDISSSGQTYTPDFENNTKHHYLRLQTGAGGTTTIDAPDNAGGEQEMFIEVFNNTAGTLTLAWDSVYVKASALPTSIAASIRVVAHFRYRLSVWVLVSLNTM